MTSKDIVIFILITIYDILNSWNWILDLPIM